MNRRTAWMVVCVGIAVLLFDVYIFLYVFKTGNGTFDLRGGDVRVLSWCLKKGELTVGSVTVSGGNEEIRFYIKDPSSEYVSSYAPRIVKTRLYCDFDARQDGVYSFHFENLDLIDKVVHADFRSPYEPRMIPGFSTLIFYGVLVGAAILILNGTYDLIAQERQVEHALQTLSTNSQRSLHC